MKEPGHATVPHLSMVEQNVWRMVQVTANLKNAILIHVPLMEDGAHSAIGLHAL